MFKRWPKFKSFDGAPDPPPKQTNSLLQVPVRRDLSRAGDHPFAPRIDDPEVPPSAVGQPRAPLSERLVAAGIAPVPRVERGRDEEVLRGAPDGGVGEDPSRVLAPPSSRPLREVGEEGPSRFRRRIDGGAVQSVLPVGRQVHVADGSEFLAARHRRIGCPRTAVGRLRRSCRGGVPLSSSEESHVAS